MRPLPFVRGQLARTRGAIIAPVFAQSVTQAREAVEALSEHPGVDVIEWRVDYSLTGRAGPSRLPGKLDWESLQPVYAVLMGAGLPILATLRTSAEGGGIVVSDTAYEQMIERLLDLHPSAIDVEGSQARALPVLKRVRERGSTSIVSFHDWQVTPPRAELDARIAKLAALGGDVVKFAVRANAPADALRVLEVTLSAAEQLRQPLIGIAMGELGRVTRLCGADFGSAASFASLLQASAPGQLSVGELIASRAGRARA